MQMLHTMLRVGDLQRSIDFYTNVLGMELLRTTERPEQKYSLAFVAFGGGNASGEAEIELTYNHGTSEYDLGDAYGHIALGVDSVSDTCDRIRSAGGKVTREPGPVKGGDKTSSSSRDPAHGSWRKIAGHMQYAHKALRSRLQLSITRDGDTCSRCHPPTRVHALGRPRW